MDSYIENYVAEYFPPGKIYMIKIQKYESEGHIWLHKVVHSKDGKYYIGSEDTADYLISEYKITEFYSTGRTANYGFSEADQKWYGWSHRAIWGYSIGSKDRLGYGKITTLEEAKENAISFAKSVS